jgi:hypothetical protein
VSQLYVMFPGSAQPTLLAFDEVIGKVRAGELPRTAKAVRPGETDWKPLGELPEVAAALDGGGSIAATRVSQEPSPFAEAPAGGTGGGALPPPNPPPQPSGASPSYGAAASNGNKPTPTGADAVKAKADALVAKARALPKAAQLGALGGAGALLLLLLVLAIYRNSYSRGLVLEHVPSGCAYMTYVDLQGIATSDPVKQYLEKIVKNGKSLSDDELEKESKKVKERAQRALDALKNNGIEVTSVREFAMCLPTVADEEEPKAARVEEKGLLVIGGTFRKGNVLKGIEEATEGLLNNEDVCHSEDDDGLTMLKCSPKLGFGKAQPIYAALLESRVLAISPDRKQLKALRTAKNRAKEYGADKGELFVLDQSKDLPGWDGSYTHASLKITDKDTVLTVETHYDEKKGKDQLASLKDADEVAKKKEKAFQKASEQCFESSPYDMLADAVAGTKVDVLDDGIRYQYKAANKDLAKAFKVLADADKDDLSKLMRVPTCVAMASN